MITFNQLKLLHIELTNRCQASCPMCSRNVHGGLPNPNLVIEDWSILEFKKIINEEVLTQIKQIQFCGNNGDTIINKDLLKILKYIKEVNPHIILGIHTNGSLHKEEWWSELVKFLPELHSVTFGIDGLEDTHSLYRIGTDYNKIISNAQAFISAGGTANWQFIMFKHNEHQINDCQELSKKLGFQNFLLRHTERYNNSLSYKVLDKEGNITHYLEPPSNNGLSCIDEEIFDDYQKHLKNIELSCNALLLQGFYIDAHKRLYPCAFYGSAVVVDSAAEKIIKKINKIMNKENKEIFKNIPTLKQASLKEIINSDEWNSFFKRQYSDNKLVTCIKHCGRINSMPLNNFKEDIL